MEVKIGRKVIGSMDVLISEEFMNVSKEHAIVIFENDTLVIKDLNSKNGTFVNGKRILSKKLVVTDEVWLGGLESLGSYSLNLKKLLEDFKKHEFENRTDFENEFLKVKDIYKQYQSSLLKLQRKTQLKSNLPKIIVSVLIGTFIIGGLVLKILPEGIQKFQGAIMLVVMGVIGGVTMSKSKDEKNIEKQLELEIKYQQDYKCPKCQKQFNLKTHWKKIESLKTCPHKCGAIFKN